MKNLPDPVVEKLRHCLAALAMYDPTGVIREDAKGGALKDFIQRIVETADASLDGICIPHDFVREAGTADGCACARCGERAHLHPDNRRVILDTVVSLPVIRRMTPEEEAIACMTGKCSGVIEMRRREPGEEVRLSTTEKSRRLCWATGCNTELQEGEDRYCREHAKHDTGAPE